MWLFAVLTSSVSWSLLMAVPDELEKGNHLVWIGLVFPLIGLFVLGKAIRMTLELHRYGHIELMMDPFPGSIGRHVGGSLAVKRHEGQDTVYRIGLECVHTYVGRRRRGHPGESIRWAEEGTAKVESLVQGVRLSFRFDVPDDLPEADIDQKGSYYHWRLRLRADVPGVNLDRTYNIPVFRTGKSSDQIDHDISAQVRALRAEKAEETQAAIARGDFHNTDMSRSVRIDDRRDEIKLYFPMLRNKFLTLFVVIFGGGFSFAAWMILDRVGGTGLWYLLNIVFAIPFALVGLFASIAAIYVPFNNLTVRIRQDHVHIIRRLFVLPIWVTHIPTHDITRLSIKKSGSTGQGVSKIEHFKILAHYATGKTAILAEDIDGEDLANQFKDYLFHRIQWNH